LSSSETQELENAKVTNSFSRDFQAGNSFPKHRYTWKEKERTMPPFGNGGDGTVLFRSGSFLKDEVFLSDRDDGVRPQDLKLLLNRMEEESIPTDLTANIRGLFEKASELEDKVMGIGKESVLAKAIDHSIRYTLWEILDQIATLYEIEGDIKLVVSALISSAVSRSFRFLDKLEKFMVQPADRALEPCLRDLMSGQDIEDQQIRVSVLSSSLAFEFMAGQSATGDLKQASSESFPLKVNIVPFLFAKASDAVETRGLIHQYKACDVKVDYCAHKKLFSSSGSGVVGEALVRVSVTPKSDIKVAKKGCAWSKGGDVGKLRLIEVRA
jgi:hypothetical protein